MPLRLLAEEDPRWRIYVAKTTSTDDVRGLGIADDPDSKAMLIPMRDVAVKIISGDIIRTEPAKVRHEALVLVHALDLREVMDGHALALKSSSRD